MNTVQPQLILTTIIKTFSLPKIQMVVIVLVKLLIKKYNCAFQISLTFLQLDESICDMAGLFFRKSRHFFKKNTDGGNSFVKLLFNK